MATNTPTSTVNVFGGINNKIDPQRLGLRGLVSGDNIDIDGAGRMSARAGRTVSNSTPYYGAFSTFDHERTYAMTSAGELEDWSASPYTLRTGFVGYPYWAQIGNTVFVGNENQCWRIGVDNVVEDNAIARPDPLTLSVVKGALPAGQYRFVQVQLSSRGRESAPSVESVVTVDGTQGIQVSGITGQRIYVAPADSRVFGWWLDTAQSVLNYARVAESLGEELRTLNLQPMPTGKCLAIYQGQLFCSVYDPRSDVSAVYRSVSLWTDLCATVGGVKFIPGEVRAMAGLKDGLLICTERQIFVLIEDGSTSNLIEQAKFGVPPGQAITFDEHMPGEDTLECWVWTQRGLYKALPFAEVTPHFAPAISDFVGTAVVRRGGDFRFIAAVSPSGVSDNST